MGSNDLQDWTYRQLQLKSVRLHGQIDGLVDYRRTLYEQLQKTVQDIANLEELRRNVDIEQDQDTLEHLRKRELELRQEIRDLNTQISELSAELEPFDLEIAGRPPVDEQLEKHLAARRRETEKRIKQVRNEGIGVLGRLRNWLFGEY